MIIPILIYHGINSEKIPHQYKNDYEFTIEESLFEEQMSLISRYDCEVISIEDLRYLNLQENRKKVIITFDDGHESVYKTALPILQKFGYKADVFQTAAFIDSPGYLTKRQLTELTKLGVSIQSHGYDHVFMPSLSKKKLMFQLQQSKKIITDITSIEANFFAYPGGQYNQSTENAVKASQYLGSCTTERGYNSTKNALYGMKRYCYTKSTKDRYFLAVINHDFTYFFLRKIYGIMLHLIRKCKK